MKRTYIPTTIINTNRVAEREQGMFPYASQKEYFDMRIIHA